MLWTDFQQPMYHFQYNNGMNEHHHEMPTTTEQRIEYTTIRKNSFNSSCSNNSEEERPRRKQQRRSNSKNMDDDEKRKNFLERNRQAALKCRQRKKQWLNNLQARVEYLSNDNEQLQIQANIMRDEVMHLRSILMAHKDCRLEKKPLLQNTMPQYMNPT